MDKELRKQLETTWTGNLIAITPLPTVQSGEKSYEKATCIFLFTGGDLGKDEIQLEAFGYSAQDLKKIMAGSHVRVSFIPSSRYFEPKDMWFTKLNLNKIELLDSGIQPVPEQTPADIYPVGNQLPTPPIIQGEAINESDFDFSTPPA